MKLKYYGTIVLVENLPKKTSKREPKGSFIHLLPVFILLIFASYGVYKYESQNIILGSKITELETRLQSSETFALNLKIEKEGLEENLKDEQGRTSSLASQNKKISKKVDTLTKLTETDPELLIKYSKVYFLNENYAPRKLDKIDTKYLFTKDKPQEILDDVSDYLKDLLEEAVEDHVSLLIASAYRSFGTQALLKSSYSVIYGAGSANQFSADQGYSEHQLGTAVDFISPANGTLTTAFDMTPEYAWLVENAYKYGFVLSYPKNNAYYQYEPWHWRFVGTALARKLNKDNKFFYDLDQRDIDAYLVKIFD